DDHSQGPERGEVDQAPQELRVVSEDVALADGPGNGRRGRAGHLAGVDLRLRQVADLAQPAVLAHRARTRAAELDAVVLRRVVAGGEHRAGDVERAARVVEAVGGAQADEGDIQAVGGNPGGEGPRQTGG